MNGMATDVYFYLKDKEEDKDNNTNTKETISTDIKTLPFELSCLSSQNHHVTRALVVETCLEENNKCKSFVKMQIIASRGQGN